MKIVATFLVSYDAEYLKVSVPLVYPHVDKIMFAIDRERLTWKGDTFSIPENFFDWVEKIDSDGKISIYEETFYLPEKKPLELDCRQRQMAAEYAGIDNTWHIQVDADEYVLNFQELINQLRRDERTRTNCDGVLYMGKLIPLFKQDKNGFFYVENGEEYEKVALAASNPKYIAARKTISNKTVIVDVYVIHQTFAREYDMLKKKFGSWGHANDFNTESYLNLWNAVDRHNYRYLANFHPNYHVAWKKLEYIEAENIQEFIAKYSKNLENKSYTQESDRIKQQSCFLNLPKRILRKIIRLAGS